MTRYTAEDLASLAGVTVRTVRYYVAEKLIDRPRGRGPGAHFDDHHLAQLKRVRFLQASGLDLPGIRAHLEELRAMLASRGLMLEDMEKTWAYQAEQSAALWTREVVDRPEVKAERVTRITLGPGLELVVSDDLRVPPPARLAELAAAITRAFKPRSQEAQLTR